MGPPRATSPTAAGTAMKTASRSAKSSVSVQPRAIPARGLRRHGRQRRGGERDAEHTERELHHAVGVVEVRDGAPGQAARRAGC